MNTAIRTSAMAWAVAAAALLSACSGMRIVDSDVSAFAPLGGASLSVPVRYRFEQLPSQQAQPAQQQALENLVAPELAKVGLQRDDSTPEYSVQVGVHVVRDPQAPWDDPRYVQGFARPFPVVTRYGVVMHNPSLNLSFDYPYYRREVSLVVRRLSDAQVVYETKAQHDGRWADDDAVLPAMLQAALRGFPAAVPGPRRVNIEIPR